MSSTTKFNQFDEDYRFNNRSDDSKHFMRKSDKFNSRKARCCGCQSRKNDDYNDSDEENFKPCCGYPDNTKCKNFIASPSKDCCRCRTSRNEDNYKAKFSKHKSSDSWPKNTEEATKLREKLKCKCDKNKEDTVQSKNNKADKRVISIYTKLGSDGLPPSNKNRKDEPKCKKKGENNTIEVIKICRNSNVGESGDDSTEEEINFESESSFYANRPDTYRRLLGPTIDETVLVCLDLFTNIAMKINKIGQSCGTKCNPRRKCIRPTKKELERKHFSSESSD